MQMTFRWYGEGNDSITPEMIKQIPGVTGLVWALHDKQAGEVWEVEEIEEARRQIEGAGFNMDVVESVNVHDDIKIGLPTRDQYIENYNADIYAEKQLRLVIVENESGSAVGTIDISDFDARDRRGFVGIALVARYRGMGYASEALGLLTDFAARTIGMHQLAAVVAVDNEASRALFEAAGYSTAGRLRSWLRVGRSYVDVLLYQRLFM